MKKILITILLLSSLPCFAQMTPMWKNITGETGNAHLWTHAMALDSKGNSYVMIVAQYLSTNESIFLQPYLIKVNSEGQTVWKKDFGFFTDRSEFPYDIKINKNDEIYFYCYQYDTLSAFRGSNLLKLDNNGNIIWRINLAQSQTYIREIFPIQLDTFGNVLAPTENRIYKINPQGSRLDSVVLTNYMDSFAQIMTNKLITFSGNKLSLYQLNGANIWNVITNYPGSESSLLYDNDNSIYLAFFRTETLIGNVLAIYKFDLKGNQVWYNEVLGPPDLYNKFYSLAPHLALSADNNLIVGANTVSVPFSSSTRSFVGKFNAQSGDSIWTVRAADSHDVYQLIDMIQDNESNIYITGLGNIQTNRYSITKISSNGEVLRRTNNSGFLNDSLSFTPIKIELNNNKDVIVSGFNDGPANIKVYAITMKYSQPVNISTGGSTLPDKFFLSQNYPNPFNPNTTINFQMSSAGAVSLKVYDMNGREVSELVNENLQAGEYKINFDGSTLPSGVYYYILTSENFSETKKMILVK